MTSALANKPITNKDRSIVGAYTCFALFAIGVTVAMMFPSPFYSLLAPTFGLPISGVFYLPTLIFAIALLVTPDVNVAGCLGAIKNSVMLIAIYGLLVTLIHWTGSDLDTMFHEVPVLQPVWTVVSPALWWVVISRLAKNYHLTDAGTIERLTSRVHLVDVESEQSFG